MTKPEIFASVAAEAEAVYEAAKKANTSERHLNPHSPEALLAAAIGKLESLTAENARLKADLAAAKAELSQVKGEAITVKAAAEKAGNAAAAKPSVKYAGARLLTNEQRDELYAEMAAISDNEQRAFYVNNIRGR